MCAFEEFTFKYPTKKNFPKQLIKLEQILFALFSIAANPSLVCSDVRDSPRGFSLEWHLRCCLFKKIVSFYFSLAFVKYHKIRRGKETRAVRFTFSKLILNRFLSLIYSRFSIAKVIFVLNKDLIEQSF